MATSISKDLMHPTKRFLTQRTGNCFYEAVITGLFDHPNGNLLKTANMPNDISRLRKETALDNRNFDRCYRSLYEVLDEMDISDIKKLELDTYSPWVKEWFLKHGDKKSTLETENAFISQARSRHADTNEYATNCEVSIIKNRLKKSGISLIITTIKPDANKHISNAYFGSEEEPRIIVIYNGINHYDAVLAIKKTVGGVRLTKRTHTLGRKARATIKSARK